MNAASKAPLYVRITRKAREDLNRFADSRGLNNLAAAVETLIREAAAGIKEKPNA
jgi:hypothetical protein